MTTFVWSIAQCEYDVATGGITVAHWSAAAQDGSHSATYYGTCGFDPDPASPEFKPYIEVSEADVLAWCWSNGVEKLVVEANLAAQIEAEQNPTHATGLPWA